MQYQNQVILNLMHPNLAEDQNKFPRSGGEAWMLNEKAKAKGLASHTINLTNTSHDLSSDDKAALANVNAKSRIYVCGHCNTGRNHMSGQDPKGNKIKLSYIDIANIILNNCTDPKNISGLTISVNGCNAGQEATLSSDGVKSTRKSFAEQLARELLKHGVEAKVYARTVQTVRFPGGPLIKKTSEEYTDSKGKKKRRAAHHQEGAKLIYSTIGGTLTVEPYTYTKPKKSTGHKPKRRLKAAQRPKSKR